MGERTLRLVRDSLYVAVGFGVLTVQKAQVRRRELERALDGRMTALRSPLGRFAGVEDGPERDRRHP